MSESQLSREERFLHGIELAFASNAAYDRLGACIDGLGDVLRSRKDQSPGNDIIDYLNEFNIELGMLSDDFYAYCEAAGALLLPRPEFVPLVPDIKCPTE